ncbi:AAA family ATPase [Chitinimonas lacunae]|uniref:AAA family ATPase n=1 Tax=Chitinimonas lacunae TaxID=1963018 RepID=A0ABV8MYV1_9NEIS
MAIIMVGSEKGGIGKTTIATNIAVASRLSGASVILVDIDPQGSSLGFRRLRNENNVSPALPVVNVTGRIGRDLISFSETYEHVFVDAGGRDSIEIRDAALVADLWIVPAVASAYDAMAMDTMLNICIQSERETGTKPNARTLINRIETLPTVKDSEELAAMLAADEDYAKYLPLMRSRMHRRLDYERSPRTGLSVIEYAPDGKAAAEICALYEEIFGKKFAMAEVASNG